MQHIVLGSSSPTRAEILKAHGIAFIQRECGFDEEQLCISEPAHFVYHATKGKMQSYLEHYDLELPVLCADTVVTANREILRKAKNVEDARRILTLQSGNTVSILTCMMYKSKTFELIDLSATHYLFRPFDKASLEAYLQGEEWKGKAGACMVEGFCKSYIKEVVGLQSTAMGLSIEKLIPFLSHS
ncbi:septum formation inhibitor Maf [Sulfurospirillum barnesii]|uniref:Nucleoside triphosphate pyrophosphatase n=1 Tax=Sulfurospirillum barnesii (strain ATCC 700032 / DSM 10660 / SES-3) TaxID=760154 RepID=I3XYJ6_SULBS|nr:septum formation inhibitor Maf [Sulfurospirillum barnesii]AFL69020.1 MAF protein [Sulfurospirillum barnesii SES-3]